MIYFYLLINSISTFGDKLLLYALPIGIGLETNDIRATIIMFLIPGMGMKLASSLSSIVKKRIDNTVFDYGVVLIVVAVLEIIVLLLMNGTSETFYKVLYCGVFVFLYSFAKEGLPRLLFHVDIYRQLFEIKKYEKFIGIDQVLQVIFSFFGALFAAYFIKNGGWEFSLIIDALTFIIFGLGLIGISINSHFIKNKNIENKLPDEIEPQINRVESETKQSNSDYDFIAVIIPIVTFVSCLYMPYISIIVEKNGIFQAYKSILVISVVNLILTFVNVLFIKFNTLQIKRFIIRFIPFVFLLSSLAFNLYPLFVFWFLAVLSSGLYYSIFVSADFSIRKEMRGKLLINYNTLVLKRMSLTQLISCTIAICIYSFPNPQFLASILITLIFIFFFIYTFLNSKRRN